MGAPRIGVECIMRDGRVTMRTLKTVPENYPRLTHITCV